MTFELVSGSQFTKFTKTDIKSGTIPLCETEGLSVLDLSYKLSQHVTKSRLWFCFSFKLSRGVCAIQNN